MPSTDLLELRHAFPERCAAARVPGQSEGIGAIAEQLSCVWVLPGARHGNRVTTGIDYPGQRRSGRTEPAKSLYTGSRTSMQHHTRLSCGTNGVPYECREGWQTLADCLPNQCQSHRPL